MERGGESGRRAAAAALPATTFASERPPPRLALSPPIPPGLQNLSGFPDKFVRKSGQTVFAMYLCPSGAVEKCQASTVLSPIGSNIIHKVKSSNTIQP